MWLLAAYRRTHSSGRLAWSDGRRPLGAVPYSSFEPGALTVPLSYDDSTINIVVIINTIITIITEVTLFSENYNDNFLIILAVVI